MSESYFGDEIYRHVKITGANDHEIELTARNRIARLIEKAGKGYSAGLHWERSILFMKSSFKMTSNVLFASLWS